MLIPLRHENMEGRRWPVISIALVLLNLSIFLATRGQIDTENPRRAEVRAHLLLIAAMHPELSQPPHVEALVTKFRTENPGTWKEAQSQSRDVADAWDARIRLMEDQGRSLSNLALGKGIRFKAASYWLLPIWLLMEIFSGAIFGQHSGVAHWAHVGGWSSCRAWIALFRLGTEGQRSYRGQSNMDCGSPFGSGNRANGARQAGRGYCITKGIGRREARFRGGLHSAIASPLT